MRKGRWTENEDKILLEYVRKNGARNWSSIRCQGLLLRDSKSCRFRWVNKLRDGLTTGRGKLSEEEVRLVMELQEQWGNKWARIANQLPGRTENDVKNFWGSTRRKQLTGIASDLNHRQNSAHSQPLPPPPPPPPPQDQNASASHILIQFNQLTLHLDGVDDYDLEYSSIFELDLPPDLDLWQFQDPHFSHRILPEEPRFFGVMRSEQETALPWPLDNFDEPPPPPTC
ncbi:hypothetical protein ZIOFF_056692 [Zingiber officinale]|uniref:Uncharacterized protein n=1 Tax=Zingiber officinale TaxID=94328 RepID=A0A8J5KL49_ZINOF|nr:hypothetical protein ZIOFF_056692 [Zingiber officinale]